MEHQFTQVIKGILKTKFNELGLSVFEKSTLIQYINEKTRSANRGSKSRSSFANLYAIYVILEDYLKKNFDKNGNYKNYEGAMFRDLFKRQRELPFGGSLQNHALNNRMNSEFQKYFPTVEVLPIIRNLETNRYWINENLIKVEVSGNEINLAEVIILVIDEYITTKMDSFQRFISACEELVEIGKTEPEKIEEFILSLIAPKQDARLFEIVSYSILKFFYTDKIIIWGFEFDKLNSENLKLYKTGRTNANDGGIDFVMKPLGTFFQVTETIDFKKYFLDIDKIQKYPITFVIKSDEPVDVLYKRIKSNALKSYSILSIVEKYMDCIEEIITISTLKDRFREAVRNEHLKEILDEIILQSKVEFNVEDADEIDEEDTTYKLQL